MSGSRPYVLDANIFIAAHQRYYGFNICPGFWRALEKQHAEKRLCSIDKVKSELLAAKDRPSDWVQASVPKTFFKGTADKAVIDEFREMVKWVQSESQYTPEAKAEFSNAADGWVIAYAKANGHMVVTHEEFAPESRRKVPMPNVCLEFAVKYCNTFEMLADLGIQFHLGR